MVPCYGLEGTLSAARLADSGLFVVPINVVRQNIWVRARIGHTIGDVNELLLLMISFIYDTRSFRLPLATLVVVPSP